MCTASSFDVAAHGLSPVAAVSLTVEHRVESTISCSTWAQELGLVGCSYSTACGIFWDQGSNPCPPAMAGGFLSTIPSGKSNFTFLKAHSLYSFFPVNQLFTWGGQSTGACCNSWGHKQSDMTEQLNWTELNWVCIVYTWAINLQSFYVCNTVK